MKIEPTAILLSPNEFVEFVALKIRLEYGSQSEFAKAHNISPQYVSDVVSGKREPGQKIMSAVGAKRIVQYQID